MTGYRQHREKKTVTGNEMNLFYFSPQWKLKVSYQSDCKHANVRHMPINKPVSVKCRETLPK